MALSNKPKLASAKRVKHTPPRSSGGERVTAETFESEAMFPAIQQAVAAVLSIGKVVAPIDVLVRMGLVVREDVEAWRFGRIGYLERVIDRDLASLGRLLEILAFHCHSLNLVATPTVYLSAGKPPIRPLRFTMNHEEQLEARYARHFVWPGKGAFHPPRPSADPA